MPTEYEQYSEYLVSREELVRIADAIRNKNRTTASLHWPGEMVSAISNIGIGSEIVDWTGGGSVNVTPSKVLENTWYYNNQGVLSSGTIPMQVNGSIHYNKVLTPLDINTSGTQTNNFYNSGYYQPTHGYSFNTTSWTITPGSEDKIYQLFGESFNTQLNKPEGFVSTAFPQTITIKSAFTGASYSTTDIVCNPQSFTIQGNLNTSFSNGFYINSHKINLASSNGTSIVTPSVNQVILLGPNATYNFFPYAINIPTTDWTGGGSINITSSTVLQGTYFYNTSGNLSSGNIPIISSAIQYYVSPQDFSSNGQLISLYFPAGYYSNSHAYQLLTESQITIIPSSFEQEIIFFDSSTTYTKFPNKIIVTSNATPSIYDNINWIINRSIITSYSNSTLTKIDSGAFCQCSMLSYIDFPQCNTIGGQAFERCVRLTSVNFPSCTTIGTSVFKYCQNLTTASFPLCTQITLDTFVLCSKLNTINFPVCTTISTSAFLSCASLVSVNFPSCITIGAFAFEYCTELLTASFPVCTTINSSAFHRCAKLSTISFPACTTIGAYAFESCTSLKSVRFPLCTEIGSRAFYNCSSLSRAYLPKCSTFGSQTFYNCFSLSSVTFSSECLTIPYGAFRNCSMLSYIDLSHCTLISDYAFAGCISLSRYSFLDCEIVEYGAFSGCTSLSSIAILGGSSGYIASFAFLSCYNLLSITVAASEVTPLKNTNAFLSTPIAGYTLSTNGQLGSIYVHPLLVSAYKVAPNWSYYSQRITSIPS